MPQRVIVASKTIKKGERFTESNLTMRRVSGGEGFSPSMYWRLLDCYAGRDYKKLTPIDL